MKIKEKAKSLVTILGTLTVLFGAFNGCGTIVPSKYNPFGEEYNRPCAAFRTNKVRKIALEELDKILDNIYQTVKEMIYKK